MTEIEEKISEFIKEFKEKEIQNYECAFSKTFGIIKSKNGKEAQISIKFECDEDEWEDDI